MSCRLQKVASETLHPTKSAPSPDYLITVPLTCTGGPGGYGILLFWEPFASRKPRLNNFTATLARNDTVLTRLNAVYGSGSKEEINSRRSDSPIWRTMGRKRRRARQRGLLFFHVSCKSQLALHSSHSYSVTRVKKIITLDDDIKKCTNTSAFLVSIATVSLLRG